MTTELENRLQEMQNILTEVRIEQAKQSGDVKDLMGWRDQFQRDIKDTLNQMNNKMDKELYEMGNSIKTLNDKMDTQNKELHQKIDVNNNKVLEKLESNSKEQAELLRKASGKLPLWASVTGGAIIAVAGWCITIAYYTGH